MTMTIMELLKKQLKDESAITKKFFPRIPYDRLDYKPHPKSMALGQLIGHIVEIPGWYELILATPELDLAIDPYLPIIIKNQEELEKTFEDNLREGLKALDNQYLSVLQDDWTMREGECIYFTMNKLDCLMQSIAQIPHHRAQLGVYLRLLDIPIPGSYGPSADEEEAMMNQSKK